MTQYNYQSDNFFITSIQVWITVIIIGKPACLCELPLKKRQIIDSTNQLTYVYKN